MGTNEHCWSPDANIYLLFSIFQKNINKYRIYKKKKINKTVTVQIGEFTGYLNSIVDGKIKLKINLDDNFYVVLSNLGASVLISAKKKRNNIINRMQQFSRRENSRITVIITNKD